MWADNDTVRLCVSVASRKTPVPGSVIVTCEACGEEVWFDARQKVIPGEHIGCMRCVLLELGKDR